MLKTETITRVATLLKIKPEDLTAAIKDEKEVDVIIDEKLATFTDDEITQVKNNEYKNGKKAGEEMAVDTVKKEMELEFTGKTVKGLAEAVAKKTLADAKIEPEKKVTELQEKLFNVQKTATELEKKLAEKDNEVASVRINGEVFKHIPVIEGWEPEEVLNLMKGKGYEFKAVEGKTVVFKDGKELQDKLSNAVPIKDVVTTFIAEKKLIPGAAAAGGGRGKGDEGGRVGFTKLSEIKAKFKADGKSELGTEFADAVKEAAKTDGFDMNA